MAERGALIDRAQAALANSPFHELHGIRVDQQHGALALCGHVSSFYHKQLAQEVVRSVCRDVKLINEIEVATPSEVAFD